MDGREDNLIERLEEILHLDPQAEESAGADDRELLELAGLLPYALEPDRPRPRVKSALFDRLGLAARPVPSVEGPSATRGSDATPFESSAQPRAWQTWAAAAAVVLAVALGVAAGSMYGRLQEQRDLVGRLQIDLAQLAEQQSETAGVQSQMENLREDFRLVTARGTRVCALQPRDPAQPDAQARIFMDQESHRWVLAARSLRRCELGRHYQVWFVTESGAVPGRAFQVEDETTLIEIGSDELPEETIAVMITLEHEDHPQEPSGPMVLYGDESRDIL